MPSKRDWDDPAYKKFREDVRKRDGYKCQMCKKKPVRSWLEVHHIRRWSNAPTIRYSVSNGISLCRKCHKSIKGKEDFYVSFFLEIINAQNRDKQQ